MNESSGSRHKRGKSLNVCIPLRYSRNIEMCSRESPVKDIRRFPVGVPSFASCSERRQTLTIRNMGRNQYKAPFNMVCRNYRDVQVHRNSP